MAESSRRTITPRQWEDAVRDQAVLPEDTNDAVDSCMAELRQGRVLISERQFSLFPWEDTPFPCRGVMWAGTPALTRIQKDENGGWLLSRSTSSTFLRLSPAPVDASVQFGMCMIYRDFAAATIRREFGVEGAGNLRHLSVGSWWDSNFRMDKMVLAFVALKASRSSTGQRFRELLGTATLHEGLVSMLDDLYEGSSNLVGTGHPQDSEQAEMWTMVAEKAYPRFRIDLYSPNNLRRFRAAMGLTSAPSWFTSSLFPKVFNVVVPEIIFRALEDNLEKNIPPLIPLYRTHYIWMFNGSWRDACTGLGSTLEAPDGGDSPPYGWAVVAGCLNQFNLDLPGLSSYWPESANPPTNWIDQFVRVIQDLGNSRIPPSLEERCDHVMDYARRVPVVFHMGGHGNVFARLVDSEMVVNQVLQVTTRRCNETGTDWLSDPLVVGRTPPTSPTCLPNHNCRPGDDDGS